MHMQYLVKNLVLENHNNFSLLYILVCKLVGIIWSVEKRGLWET